MNLLHSGLDEEQRNQLKSYIFALKKQRLIMRFPEMQKARGRTEVFEDMEKINVFVLAALG